MSRNKRPSERRPLWKRNMNAKAESIEPKAADKLNTAENEQLQGTQNAEAPSKAETGNAEAKGRAASENTVMTAENAEKIAEGKEKITSDDVKSAENAVKSAEKGIKPAEASRSADDKADDKKETERRRRTVRIINVIVMILLLIGGCFGLYTEFSRVLMDNDSFSETFYVVQSDKITARVRAAVITDLHLKEYGKDNSELLSALTALKPDIICVVGDMFLYGSGVYEPMYELLENMTDVAPVYFSLGNHEISEYLNGHREILSRIIATGAVLLNNDTVDVTVNGNLLSIGGLSEHANGIKQYAPDFMEDFTSHEGFKLLLSHYPINFQGYIEYADVDLALAGHEHGGVVRLPFVGALYSPDQGLNPDFTEGLLYPGAYPLIISRGMGDSSAFPRINNKPELVIVDITPDKLEFKY